MLDTCSHVDIFQVSPQLGCDDTWQIWTWYHTGNPCFDHSKNWENDGTEILGLVTPTPGHKSDGYGVSNYLDFERLLKRLSKLTTTKPKYRINDPLWGESVTSERWCEKRVRVMVSSHKTNDDDDNYEDGDDDCDNMIKMMVMMIMAMIIMMERRLSLNFFGS